MANQTQTLKLTFELAWGDEGTSWERFLASIISAAPLLKIISNSILFFALVRQKALRQTKEHLVIIYTTFYDIMDGTGSFCSHFYFYKIQSRLSCLLNLRHFMYVLFGQASGTMLMMISVDRLLSVAAPMWYYKQSYMLGHKLGLAAMAWGLLFTPYLVASVFHKPDELIPHCFTTVTFRAYKANFVEWMVRRSLVTASVVMYGAVVAIYTYKRTTTFNQVAPIEGVDAQARRWKRFKQHQKKMTVTLGISSMVSLIGYVAPLILFDVVRSEYPKLQQFGWLFLVPYHLSSVANIFIFVQMREVRQAFVALFSCKRLPERIDDWGATTGTNHGQPTGH